jgi:hypothetical protein
VLVVLLQKKVLLVGGTQGLAGGGGGGAHGISSAGMAHTCLPYAEQGMARQDSLRSMLVMPL